jgi:hypothetical protein
MWEMVTLERVLAIDKDICAGYFYNSLLETVKLKK